VLGAVFASQAGDVIGGVHTVFLVAAPLAALALFAVRLPLETPPERAHR
jgi:hypothetical protein